MRTIGNLDTEAAAVRFTDILCAEGIETQIEPEDEGGFSIWVIEDSALPRAADLLRRFRADPSAPEFQDAKTRARELRTAAEKAEPRRSVVADTARIGYEQNFKGFGYVALALIVICVAVAIYSQLGGNRRALLPLQISEYAHDWKEQVSIRLPGGVEAADGAPMPEFDVSTSRGFLPEIRAGQLWRLITPIFIHFGPLHLLFNMFMLKDLGTFVESRFGPRHLIFLVLALAVLSNLGQALWGMPRFGGMSGVIYGLFGFLWMRGKHDRFAGWQLNKTTVQMLLIWYVLCLTGLIGNVANTAHSVGLLAGMAWGYLSARKR